MEMFYSRKDGSGRHARVLQRMQRTAALQKLMKDAGEDPSQKDMQVLLGLAMLGKNRVVAHAERQLAWNAARLAMDAGLFSCPRDAFIDGVPYGVLSSGDRVHHPLDEIATGILTLGSPKAGKTTWVMQVVEDLVRRGTGVLICDVRGDYEPLACSVEGSLLIPGEEDRLNVLEPPVGVSEEYWMQVVAARLTLDLGLHIAGQAYCNRKLVELSMEHRGVIPCLLDFRDLLERRWPKRGTSEYGYHERVLSRVTTLTSLAGSSVVGVQRGYPIVSELEKGRLVVLDMRRHDRLWSEFALAVRLWGLYFSRLASEDPFRHPLVMVVLDEQRSFIRERPHDTAIPDVDLLFSRSRALNIGFVVVEQVPSAVSRAALTSCRLRLGFNTIPPEQQQVASLLGLNAEQSSELNKLPPGTAIARWASHRIPHPYVVQGLLPSWMVQE